MSSGIRLRWKGQSPQSASRWFPSVCHGQLGNNSSDWVSFCVDFGSDIGSACTSADFERILWGFRRRGSTSTDAYKTVQERHVVQMFLCSNSFILMVRFAVLTAGWLGDYIRMYIKDGGTGSYKGGTNGKQFAWVPSLRADANVFTSMPNLESPIRKKLFVPKAFSHDTNH